MKDQIIVTGGTGFIGSHTVVELQQSGYEVLIVDDLSNSLESVVLNIEKITGVRPSFEKLDLTNGEKVEQFFSLNQGILGVIHFAASKSVGESVENPLKYYHNNLVSLMNVIECQRKYGVPNIVFSSSCTVYGQPDSLPVSEQSPRQEAESPYGNTKRVCEDILKDCIQAYSELNGIALRYFNPIGAHPSGLIGELPTGVPQNLIPFITQTAAGIREVLTVFGNDYDTPDGSAIRDYINVVDLAKAHVVAIKRLIAKDNKSPYEKFNLGTGSGFTVLEVIDMFEKATGVSLNYQIASRREGDIEKIWADTSFANTELSWKAEVGMRETLLSAWHWQQKFQNREIEKHKL